MDWRQQRRNNLDLLPEFVKGFCPPAVNEVRMMINVGTGYVVGHETRFILLLVSALRQVVNWAKAAVRFAISRSLSIASPDLLTRRHPPENRQLGSRDSRRAAVELCRLAAAMLHGGRGGKLSVL